MAMRRFIAAAATIILSVAVRGDELHVPTVFATIQAAVDAAVDGDHVIVGPGTYHEALDLLGKKITIRSSAGPTVTILDGALQETSIITAISGESLDTVLEGFTFRHGGGRFTQACNLGGHLGGAIFAQNSGLSVVNSIFERNGTREEEGGRRVNGGGAIFACHADLAVSGSTFRGSAGTYGGAINFYAAAHHMTISNSTFANSRGAHGGAVLTYQELEASFTLTGSDFDGNEATHGGSVRVTARDRSVVRISGSTFRNGTAAFGGGLNMTAEERARIDLTDSNILHNEAGFGGGLFSMAWGRLPAVAGGRISVTNSRFLDNVAHECCDVGIYLDPCFTDGRLPEGSGLYYGGGADVRAINGGIITFTNALFARNSAPLGGGVHLTSCQGGSIDLVNTTIVENEPSGAHLRLSIPTDPDSTGVGHARITNSIIRQNRGGTQLPIDILASGPTATVTFSNVEGGAQGPGNIDTPVTFADAGPCDYRLASGSPGIDGGNNDAIDPSVALDLAGDPRFADDPASVDAGSGVQPVVDMGAYEHQPAVSAGGRRRGVSRNFRGPCPAAP